MNTAQSVLHQLSQPKCFHCGGPSNCALIHSTTPGRRVFHRIKWAVHHKTGERLYKCGSCNLLGGYVWESDHGLEYWLEYGVDCWRVPLNGALVGFVSPSVYTGFWARLWVWCVFRWRTRRGDGV